MKIQTAAITLRHTGGEFNELGTLNCTLHLDSGRPLARRRVFALIWLPLRYVHFPPPPLPWRCSPTRAMASSFLRFLDHTQWRNTVGRTPLDEWSARRRDLYLTTHNNHNRQISMPPGGIRTHDLNRWATAELHLRPRGYWDRPSFFLTPFFK